MVLKRAQLLHSRIIAHSNPQFDVWSGGFNDQFTPLDDASCGEAAPRVPAYARIASIYRLGVWNFK